MTLCKRTVGTNSGLAGPLHDSPLIKIHKLLRHTTAWLIPSDILLSKNKPTSKGCILHEEHNMLENQRWKNRLVVAKGQRGGLGGGFVELEPSCSLTPGGRTGGGGTRVIRC